MEHIISLLDVKEFQIVITFFISLFITLTAIPVIINISKLKDLMAEIQDRSSHQELTPTLGGVAIFAATLISYFLWDNPNEGHDVHLVISAIIILFFLGIKDDILILSPRKKLYIQIAASLLVISFGDLRLTNLYGIFNIYEVSYIVGIIFTTFIFIAVTNAINLIDGIDGLAGMVGLFASMIFSYVFFIHNLFAVSTLALALAGSLCGFLRYNWSIKNKIFMGDTGSLIVGFLLSFFAVKFVIINTNYMFDPELMRDAPLFVVILLMLPVFDTVRMFLVRLIDGKSPFVGDRKHLHHILIDLNFSHLTSTIILLSFNTLILIIFIKLSSLLTISNLLFFVIFVFIIYCLISYFLSNIVDKKHIDRLNFGKIDKLKRMKIIDEKRDSIN